MSDWTPWEEGSGTKEIQDAKGQALGIGETPEFKRFVGQWVSKTQTNVDSFTQRSGCEAVRLPQIMSAQSRFN